MNNAARASEVATRVSSSQMTQFQSNPPAQPCPTTTTPPIQCALQSATSNLLSPPVESSNSTARSSTPAVSSNPTSRIPAASDLCALPPQTRNLHADQNVPSAMHISGRYHHRMRPVLGSKRPPPLSLGFGSWEEKDDWGHLCCRRASRWLPTEQRRRTDGESCSACT